MKEEISALIKSVENSTGRVKAFSSLSEAQLNWKPAPEKWSAGECIEHLVISNKTYFPEFELAARGEHKNSLWKKITPLSGFWGKMLIKIVSPDNVKKAKAPGIFRPVSSNVSKSIIDDFAAGNEKLINYMNKFRDAEPDKIIISSPVNGFITYSLSDTLKILAYHEERHINQAEAVTKLAEFPLD